MFLMCIGGQMAHLIPDDPECCVFCIGLEGPLDLEVLKSGQTIDSWTLS